MSNYDSESKDLNFIAENIAWMFNNQKADINEVRAAIMDITGTLHLEIDLVDSVYLKYIDIVGAR